LEAGMNLRDAIGKDFYVIDGSGYIDEDLKKMSLEALESLRLRIELKISSLSMSIKANQIDYASSGKGTTKEWYTKHKYVLSINQRVLPYIANLIKQRRREQRRNISDYFMDEAKAYLKQNDFEEILKNARHEMAILWEEI
jgi:hypothetical protein